MATAIVAQPVQSTHPDLLALAHAIADDEGVGLKTALVLAELYHDDLMAYADMWDAWAATEQAGCETSEICERRSHCCPECGSAIVSRQYYVGGRG